MHSGTTRLQCERSTVGFFAFFQGATAAMLTHLRFEPGGKKVQSYGEHNSRTAYRCLGCEAMLILGAPNASSNSADAPASAKPHSP
jgi:hypothetical protein